MSGEAPSRFDCDPEALSWARGKVHAEVDRMERFMAEAQAAGDNDQMLRWRRHRNLLKMRFVGGAGCVIAAFDPRLPVVLGVLDSGRCSLMTDDQDRLPLIGRDRVWIDKLTKSIRPDLGELGTVYETRRGNTFEVRYGAPGDPTRYIAKVTVELDRVEEQPNG